MFGQNSSWNTQQQQQQQQPQQGGLFGGGSTFGQQNTGGFGQPAGGFGQPAQPQQTGGLFGGGNTGTNTFGGFGANQQANTTFGSTAPRAPGFGATGSTFGQNTTTGGLFGSSNTTNTFGANNTSGGLFGKPATPAGGGFGAGATSSLFGAKPASPFGAAQPNVPQALPPVPQTGTLNPVYEPTWQKDPPPQPKPGETAPAPQKDLPAQFFHVISAMEPYRGASFEELRMLDYQNGRKKAEDAPPPAMGFGQTTGFGQTSTNTFGQPAASTSTFGAKPGGLFGSTTTTGGFGSTTGGFGQPAQTGGLFGQTQPAQNTFGQTNTTGGGLFGQQPAQPATGGLFGSTTNTFGQTQQPAATSTFGGFGAAKPAFGATGTSTFGQPAAPTNTFGQPAASTSTFGGFGAQPQQQQQAPATGGGLFGGGGFGANNTQQNTTGGGLFGQTQQQPAAPATGGLFGNTAAKPGGLFGSTTQPTSTFGGFGQTQPAQPAATGGLFGNTSTTNTTGTSLFGQPQQQQAQPAQPATGGLFGGSGSSLFGAKPAQPATGSLFGQTQTTQPAQTGSTFGGFGQTGSLFGNNNNNNAQQNTQNNAAKPAGSLFGGGLFGQQNQQPAQTNTGGGLFGNLGQSQAPTTSLFGNTQQQPQQQNGLGQSGGLFGSTFGQSTNQQQQQQQPSLTASIDQNPYGNNQLFAYQGQKLEYGSQNKKPALPPMTSSSFRGTPTTKGKVVKLRGFASPLNASQSPGRSGSPLPNLGTPGRSSFLNSPATSDRYKGLSDTALSPNAFIPRPSVKKLSITPRHNGISNGEDHLDAILGKSLLKSSNVKATPDKNGSPFTPQSTNGTPNRQVDDTPIRKSLPAAESSLRVSGSERQPKQGEYWCKPRIERLKQMGHDELSRIENFTAGRKGYGEVTFLQPVDLTSVPSLSEMLGSIIVFNELELVVYPGDGKNKPSRGHGLNVPAKISLENCFIKDKATKQPVTDVSDMRYARHLKRIKNIKDTEFISFTDDGTWTFKVEHFSRYGLFGSDDEEYEEDGEGSEEEVAGGVSRSENSRSKSRSPSQSESEDDEDFLPPTKSMHDKEESETDGHDSGLDDGDLYSQRSDSRSPSQSQSHHSDTEMEQDMPEPGWDRPLKAKLGYEGTKKLREMQTSFFGEKQRLALDRYSGGQTQRSDLKTKRLLEDGAFFREAGEESTPFDEGAVKRSSFGEKVISPPKLRQPRKFARVSLEKGSVIEHEGVKADAGLALGRSFRCSWGPGGTLVHFGKICSPSASFTSAPDATVTIEDVGLLSEEPKAESRKATRLLNLHLENTLIETVDSVPYAGISSDIRFQDFTKLFESGDRSHEATIWRLGQALFDEIDLRLSVDTPDEVVERVSEVRRKLALSRWLESAVSPSVDSDLLNNSDQASKIFTFLTGNQVDRAVEAAIAGSDMRLATLLSQIGGPESFREEVGRQLEDWKKYKVNPMISTEYRRLYTLLAGITDISPGESGRGSENAPDVLIAKGLDWKRCFGLHLWFGNTFEQTIGDALEAYTASLSLSHPPAKPLPPYLEKPSSSATKIWKASTEPTDILSNLIRMFSDITIPLDNILRSRDCSPSPLDFRLPWHLYILLSRVLGKRDFVDRDEENGYSAVADSVTSGYAVQLEDGGDWRLAAFVLLHLETSDGREQALKALLNRHSDLSPDDEAFITGTLKVPRAWVHASKAARLSSEGDAFGEYHQLIQAGLLDKAHKVLVDKLAPEAVIRKDVSLLRRLCEPLEGRHPDGWEFGGKLLLEYADLSEETPHLLEQVQQSGSNPDPHQHSTLTTQAQTLPRVIQLLPALFPDKEDVQQIAGLSDMLSELHKLARALHVSGYQINRPAVPPLLVDEDRLHLLQSAAFDSFDKSLKSIAA